MHKGICIGILLAFIANPVMADDRAIITNEMQEMADAITYGHRDVWERDLDPDVIYAEEDDSFKGKAAMVAEVRLLPKGISGEIKIQLLSYHQDGDVAVALYRQIETEVYHSQTLPARYLTNTTWRKRADGWKLIAAQVLAEKDDPPAISLPASALQTYVGSYRLKGAEAIYDVRIANGRLIAARSGRAPVTWNAEATDVFFAKGDPRIRDIFQRDSSGRITAFVERRESWDVVWEKVR